MDADRTRRFAPRLFLGLVVISLGLLALLNNLGVIDVDDPWRFWPLALVALGLSRVLRPAGSPGRFTGVILCIIGGWLLLDRLNLINFNLFDFWPVLVVLVGARLIWGSVSRRALEGPATEGTSHISACTILGGSEHRSASPAFKGGDATAILGGCKIDLRGAAIKDGEAVLDVFALWGGVEILIPPDWSLIIHAAPILGAVEDKTRPPQPGGGARLVVKGVVIMGGIEIKN